MFFAKWEKSHSIVWFHLHDIWKRQNCWDINYISDCQEWWRVLTIKRQKEKLGDDCGEATCLKTFVKISRTVPLKRENSIILKLYSPEGGKSKISWNATNIQLSIYFLMWKIKHGNFLGSPGFKTLCFQYRGHEFSAWLEYWAPTCWVAWPKKKTQKQLNMNVN